MPRQEWHYYSDTDHSWRRVISGLAPNKRESTHLAGPSCGKLCRDGLWPMPVGLLEKAMAGNPGIGPFGFKVGQYADSWREVIDGRLFYFIRHRNESTQTPTSATVGELVWRKFNRYSHIPGMENTPPEWGWCGVQSMYRPA